MAAGLHAPTDLPKTDRHLKKIGRIFSYVHQRCIHLLGMARMGKTNYATLRWEEMNAKTIIGKLDKIKVIKRSRRYRCHYASITVKLGKLEVKLFFCRMGKRDNWKELLTTDLSLDFMLAY